MRNKGFTLIEMMAIIIILAVIALFSFPSILELISNNEIKNNEEQLSNLYIATENYIVQNYKDEYKTTPFYITIEELISNDYVRMDSKITAYKEDDLIKVNKDDNGVWIYTLKPNLFDITKVISTGQVTNDGYGPLTNNGDGTLTVETTSEKGFVVAGGDNRLRNYAKLEVGKKYRLIATTTGGHKCIWLYKSGVFWTFDQNYKPSQDPTVVYGHEITITENDLNSIVYWYATGKSTSATISDIRIIEID